MSLEISGTLNMPDGPFLRPFSSSTAHFDKARQACTNTQRYTYRVLQTIQMKLILLCVWAEPAVLGSTKTALKFKYET